MYEKLKRGEPDVRNIRLLNGAIVYFPSPGKRQKVLGPRGIETHGASILSRYCPKHPFGRG
jgi:hypothetical protein